MKKLLSIVSFMLLIGTMQATVVVVDMNGNGDYADIPSAITNSTSGDTIYVVGSPASYGNFTLSSPRTIMGNGYYGQSTGYSPSSKVGTVTLGPGSATSVLSNLETGTITFSDNNLTVRSCLIAGPISITSTITGVTFERCLFTSSFSNNAATATVANSIFNSTLGGSTVSVSGSGSVDFTYCTFYDGNQAISASTAANCIVNATRVSQSPALLADGVNGNVVETEANLLFESALPQDQFYQLAGGSPGLTGSTEGTESGAFGFPTGQPEDAYILSGLPQIPIITELTHGSSANTSSNLSIRIQASN